LPSHDSFDLNHITNKPISRNSILFFLKKLSIIKPTTLNTNEQETIGNTVADPVACVVSMPSKYQHVVSNLGSEEWENYIKWQTLYHQISAFQKHLST